MSQDQTTPVESFLSRWERVIKDAPRDTVAREAPEWVTALRQALARMEQVEDFKRGRAPCLPACEAAIAHAKKVLEDHYAPE